MRSVSTQLVGRDVTYNVSAGQSVTLAMAMSQAVVVNKSSGTPTLTPPADQISS